MATNASAITTAEQLWAARLDSPCELIRGELVMMSPAGGYHCGVAGRIGGFLQMHMFPQELGEVFVSEPGFIIERNPDTVRVPDVAFVSLARLEAHGDYTGFFDLAPDLAVEVLSPRNSKREFDAKAKQWLAAGSKLVFVVFPNPGSISVHQRESITSYENADDVIDAHSAVPGWKLRVGDVFPKR